MIRRQPISTTTGTLFPYPTRVRSYSLAPKTGRPAPPVSESWPVGDAYLAQSEAALPALSYGQVFTDPRLQALIEQALANNRDLRTAFANVAAARAQVRVTRSAQLDRKSVV